MPHGIETFVRRVRRWLSRSERSIGLLGLSRCRHTESEPGLILIQIDGLSRNQLERAMASGHLPFLQRLCRDHRYRLHSLYSGMPSTTPAMTAELLYGVKGAVPAFSFLDRSTGRVFRMFEPHAAKEIEKRLRAQGEPLLADGSAYAGIYTGGAAESHFCAASMGLSDFLHAKHPFRLFLLLVLNVYSFVRTLVLLAVEFVLAFVDCARGLIAGRDLWKEIKFVPSRVGVCILMRELAVIGAKMDAARGLPAIFLDLIGYDEQSHRRGPSSRFAHWSLKGIDDAIARIWKGARRSARRDYDVWIYSDHGNEDVRSYAREHGRSVRQAVADVFDKALGPDAGAKQDLRGIRSKRTRAYLSSQRTGLSEEAVASDGRHATAEDEPIVAAMGPVGHVYLREPVTGAERDRLGRLLVDRARIPTVLAAEASGQVRVWNDEGTFLLPDDAQSVLARGHPFFDEVTQDLIQLCHHANAGDFVMSGWNRSGSCYTFPVEGGAHAGPGPAETHAFALVPNDAPLPSGAHLRPLSLRRAALHHLERDTNSRVVVPTAEPEQRTLRVMTYNVHSCVGLDGKLSPRRIARVIARHEPDVVALQEVDVGRSRTEHADQAETIAGYLNMEYHFHPAMQWEEELYGDCILSRLPMRVVRAGALPTTPSRGALEPRGALWVTVETGGTRVYFLNTHLGLKAREKWAQIHALLGNGWIGSAPKNEPIVLCGDFNASPRSRVWRFCTKHFRDVQTEGAPTSPRPTWFGHYPIARIDHVFVSSQIEVVGVTVGDDYLSRIASDHRPLFAELRINV